MTNSEKNSKRKLSFESKLYKWESIIKRYIDPVLQISTIIILILGILFVNVPEVRHITEGSHWAHYTFAFIYAILLTLKGAVKLLLRFSPSNKEADRSHRQSALHYIRALNLSDADIKDRRGVLISSETVTKECLSEVINIAHQAWDYGDRDEEEKDIDFRTNYFTKIFNLNNEVFRFIKLGDRRIGYISVIPMATLKHYGGQKNQYEFDSEDILPNGSTSDYIYLQAAFVREASRDKEGGIYCGLIQALIMHIAHFINGNADSVTLYAEQFTEDGEKLLSKMGFTLMNHKSKSHEPKPMWDFCLNADHISDLDRKQNAIQTASAIKKAITPK